MYLNQSRVFELRTKRKRTLVKHLQGVRLVLKEVANLPLTREVKKVSLHVRSAGAEKGKPVAGVGKNEFNAFCINILPIKVLYTFTWAFIKLSIFVALICTFFRT